MAKQTVNIGATPNDGTGDPIRDAFNKVNQNFDELYSSYAATGSISVGNSTVNSVVSNTGGLVVSNSTVSTVANTDLFKIGNTTANATMVSTQVTVYGNTVAGTGSLNATAVAVGNATVNSSLSQNTLTLVDASFTSSLNTSAISIGNSSVNTVANSSKLTVSSINNTTNTLTLGSSSVGSSNFANGYSRLPNGLIMQWGYIAGVNTTANTTTFASVGGVAMTNVFNVSVSAASNNYVYVSSANSTALVLVSSNTANPGGGIYWQVLGK